MEKGSTDAANGAAPPKRQVYVKFLLLCALLFGYFAYLSYEYDVLTGGVASLLTWSFFVLGTPVADAGFLVDFPLRLLFGIRMVLSELVVWVFAIGLNAVVLTVAPGYYDTTGLTRLLHQILTKPVPYWAIVGLSAAGTFLSIRFGDELMDVVHHRDRRFFLRHHFKYELILLVSFVATFWAYYRLMASLGLSLPK